MRNIESNIDLTWFEIISKFYGSSCKLIINFDASGIGFYSVIVEYNQYWQFDVKSFNT